MTKAEYDWQDGRHYVAMQHKLPPFLYYLFTDRLIMPKKHTTNDSDNNNIDYIIITKLSLFISTILHMYVHAYDLHYVSEKRATLFRR